MFKPEAIVPASFAHLTKDERIALLTKGALVAKPYGTGLVSTRGHSYPVCLHEYVIANGRTFARERVDGERRKLEFLQCSYRE